LVQPVVAEGAHRMAPGSRAPRRYSPSGADPGEGTGEQSGAQRLALGLDVCAGAAGS
jgi:hypothetical protein